MHPDRTDRPIVRIGAVLLALVTTASVRAEDQTASAGSALPAAAKAHGAPPLGPPPGARRLAPDADAWIDPVRKVVVMDGEVCFREGPLEMFACTRGSKEHESILSVKTSAYVIHAALLTVGAETGAPAQFTPAYVPARGTEIGITVAWVGRDGKQHGARAQDWIRDVRTKKAMTHKWVFAGSAFWTDPQTGTKYYQAEGGDFICVSNFPSAMLDLPVESTQVNEGLLFEAFTERIPALGTRVRVVLVPQRTAKK